MRGYSDRWIAVLVTVLVAGLFMGGVMIVGAQETPDDDDGNVTVDETDVTTVGDVQNTSYLRVVHATADAPDVDVYLDNQSVLTDVSFGEVSDYERLSGGTYDVMITEADNRENVVFEGNLTLDPRTVNTLAATGGDGAATEASLQPVLYRDDAFEPNEDNAALSVIHLSPDAPAVDVVTEENGTVLAENVTFQNASDYVTVPAGQYTVEVREASPDNDGDVVTSTLVTLDGGSAYSAMAAGQLGADAGNQTGDGVTETPMGETPANETDAGVDNETVTPAGPGEETEQVSANASFRVILTEDATINVSLPDDETAEPGTPTETPEEPETPTETPEEPDTPTETPEEPETPTETPGEPGTPEEPGTPTETPGEPGTPEEPGAPTETPVA